MSNWLPKDYRPKIDYETELSAFIEGLVIALESGKLRIDSHAVISNWLDIFEEAQMRYEVKKAVFEKKLARLHEAKQREEEQLQAMRDLIGYETISPQELTTDEPKSQ